MIEPGEVYLADFRSSGRRPVIVVSREALNRGNYLLVVPCTSSQFLRRSGLPSCVPFRVGEFGFTTDCVAQCESVLPIAKTRLDFVGGPIGMLDESAMRDVTKAIGYVLQADCEPD